MEYNEHLGLARKRGIDDLTDCSFYLPPKVLAEEK